MYEPRMEILLNGQQLDRAAAQAESLVFVPEARFA